MKHQHNSTDIKTPNRPIRAEGHKNAKGAPYNTGTVSRVEVRAKARQRPAPKEQPNFP